jgi:hypothetical protein
MCADAPHKDTRSSEGKNTNPEQQQPEIPPTLRAELQIPQSVINDCHSDQKKKYRLERWKFIVEILTLFAIIIYAIITYYQWTTMREATQTTKISATAATNAVEVAKKTAQNNLDSIKKTLAEMNIQSEAMKASARAAKESNENFLAVSRLDRRAWIGIKEIIRITEPKLKETLIFSIKIQNTGKTPARKVIIHGSGGFKKPEIKTIDPPDNRPIKSEFAMAPQTEFLTPVVIERVSEDDMMFIIGKIPFYVYGTIHYIDVDNINRKTTFCAEFIYKAVGDPALTFCPEFNDIE